MGRNPKHIGIILDGNRRFAKRLMLKPWKGHEFGYKKVKKLIEWCSELSIKEVSLYAWSLENFNRPKQEFDYIMRLFRRAFDEVRKEKTVHEKKIRINFVGSLRLFPESVQKSMRELMEATRNYNNVVVNFCMAYGGRQEIVDAAKNIVADVEAGKIRASEISEEMFRKYLYMADEPDMIIRTGGEQRLSGFLLYASSYSELIFLQKTWPEFEKADLAACIEEFKKRERRFGK